MDLPIPERFSHDTKSFAKHVFDLHNEVRRKIALSDADYKVRAGLHRRYVEFQEGDLVMVLLRPKQFPKGKHQKLHSRSGGPYKVLKNIRLNAYVIKLPKDFNISSIFNVKDLTIYHGHHEDENVEVQEL